MGSEADDDRVQRVTRAYAAFNRGDLDAVLDELRPTAEFEFIRAGFGSQGPIFGAAGFRKWMEPDALESQTIEPVEVRASRHAVLVHQHGVGRGAGSGIEVSAEAWAVWTFDRDGRLTRLHAFTADRESEAREAAGLE